MLLRLRLAHRSLRDALFAIIEDGLISAALHADGQNNRSTTLDEQAVALEAAERQYGREMNTSALAGQLAAILRWLSAEEGGDFAARRSHAGNDGCEATHFPHRHESNLVLDPDPDSYYTMSIVMLRLPQLVARLPLGRSA